MRFSMTEISVIRIHENEIKYINQTAVNSKINQKMVSKGFP